MLNIRELTPEDHAAFLDMCRAFYHSPAVCHAVPDEIFEDTFSACLDRSPYLRGLALEDEAGIAGYALLTFTYSAEVGGLVVLVDEVYFQPRARGKGYGTHFFQWLFAEYRHTARRFRLEVTDENPGAYALYRRLGFTELPYRQMILDDLPEEETE